MRIIKLFDPKLKEYLKDRNELVKEGRKLSGQIEIVDRKLDKNKEKQRKYTAEMEPKELIDRGWELDKKIAADLTELENIQKEIHKLKVLNIPEAVGNEYETLKKQKEDIEIERNKVALKVQKLKDRLIPIAQKLMRPHLGEFEDMESVEIKGEKIEVKVYSHLNDWKKAFKEKNKRG